MSSMLIDKIVSDLLNTEDSYGEIAEKNGITIEEFYELLSTYLNENSLKIISNRTNNILKREFVETTKKTKRKRGGFNPKDTTIEKINEIIEWCNKNGRLPKSYKYVYEYEGKDQLSEEELLEFDYYVFLNNFIISNDLNIVDLDVEFDVEENDLKMEITKSIYEILEKYSASKRFKVYRDALELKRWSDEKGFKPRDLKKNPKQEDELTEEEIEEMEAFNTLRTLRRLKNIETIPAKKREAILQILREVEERYRSTDEAFLNELKETIGNDSIKLSSIQIEVIERILNGETFLSVSKETGTTMEKVFSIVDSFCAKYNCHIKQPNRGNRFFEKNDDKDTIEK